MTKRNLLATIGTGLLCATILGACETPAPTETFPEMTFQHLPALKLDVAKIEKSMAPGADTSTPEAAAQFPVLPSKVVSRWADDRLKAAGTGGTASFTVTKSVVRDTALPVEKGVTGLFKKELSDRYSAEIEAKLEVVGDGDTRRAEAVARAAREATVREDMTINERRRRLYKLIEDLMADFNAEMEKNIRQYMAGFLR